MGKRPVKYSETSRGKLAFFLHSNLGLHVIITFMINLISSIIVIGIFELFSKKLLIFTIPSFLIFIAIATLIEVSLLIFVIRYFVLLIYKSFGTIMVLIQGLVFYLAHLLLEDITFVNSLLLSLLYFTVVFLVVKLLIVIIYQRYIMIKISGRN